MILRRTLLAGVAAISIAALCLAPPSLNAQPAGAVAIDNDDIGGVVTGPSGPEAGVWVIAETRDLPVRYIKIVVTDDQGRYVIPDLPKANYDVWVRGYGLVDSPKVKSEPGKQLNLTAVDRAERSGGRAVLPGDLLVLDDEDPRAPSVFGSKDAARKRQAHRLSERHEEQRLRRLPSARPALDAHDSEVPPRRREEPRGSMGPPHPVRARRARTWSIQAAGQLGGVPFKYLGDWTERVAKGELPDAKPTRPQGVERNIVVTLRDWHNRQAISARPDLERPPLPDRQRLRAALRPMRARLQRHADPRSGEERCDELRAADRDPTCRSRSGPATPARSRFCSPRPIGARRTSGTARPTTTTRCSIGRAACGSLRQATSRTIRRSARKARAILRRSSSRSTARIAASRCTIRRPASTPRIRPASARIICSSATTATRRCGRDRRRRRQCRLAQHQDARRDRRHREVAGLDRAGARYQRQRQARRIHRAGQAEWIRARTCASARRSTR